MFGQNLGKINKLYKIMQVIYNYANLYINIYHEIQQTNN